MLIRFRILFFLILAFLSQKIKKKFHNHDQLSLILAQKLSKLLFKKNLVKQKTHFILNL